MTVKSDRTPLLRRAVRGEISPQGKASNVAGSKHRRLGVALIWAFAVGFVLLVLALRFLGPALLDLPDPPAFPAK